MNPAKRCPHCGLEKPLEDFWVDQKRRSGRFPWCIICCHSYYKREETKSRRGGSLWDFKTKVYQLPSDEYCPPLETSPLMPEMETVHFHGQENLCKGQDIKEELNAYSLFLNIRFEFNIPRAWTKTFRYSTVFGLNQKAEGLKMDLAYKLQDLLEGKKIYHNKLWIAMTIYKPRVDHRNEYYVQLISQVVQHVTKLPSTWYCYQIDWAIDKKQPGVVLSIIQVEAAHKYICGICGKILSPEDFIQDRNQKSGCSGICRGCNAIRCKEPGKNYRRRARSALSYSFAGGRNRQKGISSPL
mgnify:FL=1